MPSVCGQEESTCYKRSAINFHLGETPPRELWERERTEPVAQSATSQVSSTTVLRNTPICGAATSTTSPGLSHTEGFRCTPAPVGVPVQIKSPGLSVANVLM